MTRTLQAIIGTVLEGNDYICVIELCVIALAVSQALYRKRACYNLFYNYLINDISIGIRIGNDSL